MYMHLHMPGGFSKDPRHCCLTFAHGLLLLAQTLRAKWHVTSGLLENKATVLEDVRGKGY